MLSVPVSTADDGAEAFVREQILSLVGGHDDGKAFVTNAGGMLCQYRFFAALMGAAPEVLQMCLAEKESFAHFDPDDTTTHLKVTKTNPWRVISNAINGI